VCGLLTPLAVYGHTPCMADNRVKEAREKRGLTQPELHRAAEIPLSTLQKIERRVYSPNVDYALGIAEALGEPVEELFMRPRSRRRLKQPA
jgi:DNA-binding XRE family transcriptional regulator